MARTNKDIDTPKDALNPGAGLALARWGHTLSWLNTHLEWKLSKADLTRMFQGHPFEKSKINWVLLTLTKYLYSKNHTDYDITCIYWEDGKYADPRQLDDLRQGRILHHGHQSLVVHHGPPTAPVEPFRATPNRKLLSALQQAARKANG